MEVEVGAQIGDWTVVEQLKNDRWGNRRWLVECRCGLVVERQDGLLRYGRSKGCLRCRRVDIRLPGSLPQKA